LNNCVIATIGHVDGVLAQNSGTRAFIFTDDRIIELYSDIAGYAPGQKATDRGCDQRTALNYWANNGVPRGSVHDIAGWMSVNPSDPDEYRTALWLFENLLIGMELPDAWINLRPTMSNFVWGVVGPPNPKNDHCVAAVAYTANCVTISTWGITRILTNAAIAKYATQGAGGELRAVLSQDCVNKATHKAPNGFGVSWWPISRSLGEAYRCRVHL
jgi:hypothetical protein